MANVDAPFGFRPVKHISGAEYNGQTNQYSINTAVTVFGVGDPVILSGTADTNGIPGVLRAPDDGLIIGVIASFEPDRENQGRTTLNVGESSLVNVVDSPDVIYEIQVNDSGIVLNDIGNIADFVVGNANTSTGKSIYELDGSDIGTGDDLRILRKKQIEDNTIDTVAANGAFSIVEVVFTKHLLSTRSTTAV